MAVERVLTEHFAVPDYHRLEIYQKLGGYKALETVLASGMAVVSYDKIGRTLSGITEANIPAMGVSLRLAKSSAEISAIAPALLRSH